MSEHLEDRLRAAAALMDEIQLSEGRPDLLREAASLLAEAKTALEHARIDYPEIINYVALREGTPYGLLQTQKMIDAALAKLKAGQGGEENAKHAPQPEGHGGGVRVSTGFHVLLSIFSSIRLSCFSMRVSTPSNDDLLTKLSRM